MHQGKRQFGNSGISIGIGIGIGINFLLFEKVEHLCSFFSCLVMASVRLCDKYLFLYHFVFIHPKTYVGVLKKTLNIRKHPTIGFSKKKLTSKTSRVYSFLGKLADFPGSFLRSCLEQLFCEEPVGAWNSTADIISGILQNLKSTQVWTRFQQRGSLLAVNLLFSSKENFSKFIEKLLLQKDYEM